MEDYTNEMDTNEEEGMPLCPHCGEAGDCDHVLVLLDRTYNEILNSDDSGIYNLRNHLKMQLLPYLRSGVAYTGKDKYLEGLWQHAAENYTLEDEDLSIDLDIFHDWLLEQASLHGAAVEDLEDVSGMGYSSKMYLVYAEDTDELLHKIEARLDEELPEPEEE